MVIYDIISSLLNLIIWVVGYFYLKKKNNNKSRLSSENRLYSVNYWFNR